jgi:hypothetical protein
MAEKDTVVLQSYTHSENMLVGPCCETYPTCHDGNQTMNMKAEQVSDADEEVDPVPINNQEIKAEPEVSFMSRYICVGQMHRYAETQFSSRFLSVCAHVTTPLYSLLYSEMVSL